MNYAIMVTIGTGIGIAIGTPIGILITNSKWFDRWSR